MQSRFDFRSPLTLFLTGVCLFIVFSIVWWQGVYQSPKKVWSDMLGNNLTTNDVTKNELASSNGQASLQQITLQLGGDNVARSLVTVRSNSGSVTTESIGKKDAAYIRYLNIAEPKKKQQYSGITNVWATAKGDASASDLAKLFSQSLLDVTAVPVPPLGFVAPETRANLLDYAKTEDIFTPDYSTIKTQSINGRKAYAYTVSVKLAPYVRLMQEFSHVYGLTDLDSASPSAYQSAAPVKLTIAVDVLSHQMLRVSEASGGFNETYTDYGIHRNFSVPKKAITTTELRKRLGSLQ